MTRDTSLTVGFLPWWPQNPYQVLLKRELNALGWRVIGNPEPSLSRLFIGRDGFDVLHVHWPHGLYKTNVQMLRALLLLLAYRLVRNNIVWTVHELDAYESRHPKRDDWFRGMVMRLSRRLIVHGEHTRHELVERHHYRRPIDLARHPSYVGWYRADMSREQARAKLGIAPQVLTYLYFGYIKPYKGVEDLIEAFRALPGADKVLLVAGKPLDDATAQHVSAMAAPDPRIRLHLRYIADDEIQCFFHAADVAVLPFRQAQTSGSLILAMSFGSAVVAPRIATLPEYMDQSCGIFFDPAVPGDLGRVLAAAALAPRAELGRRARERVEAATWPAMAAVHQASYAAVGRRR